MLRTIQGVRIARKISRAQRWLRPDSAGKCAAAAPVRIQIPAKGRKSTREGLASAIAPQRSPKSTQSRTANRAGRSRERWCIRSASANGAGEQQRAQAGLPYPANRVLHRRRIERPQPDRPAAGCWLRGPGRRPQNERRAIAAMGKTVSALKSEFRVSRIQAEVSE